MELQITNSPVDMVVLNTAKTDINPKLNLKYDITSYIPFGSDNLFPQAMALFARMSPNHRGVVNGKQKNVLGTELASDDKEFQKFIEKCNLENENLHDVLGRSELDYTIGGNAYFEIITDIKNSFIFISQIDFTKCRKSKENTHILINPDWSQSVLNDSDTRKLPLYPNFEKDLEYPTIQRSVFHLFDYEPEFYWYGVPSWIAGKDSVQLDLKTNRFNLARLINSFKISGMMFVPVKDKNESAEVLKKIQAEHVGDMNQDKLMIITKSRSSESERTEQVQLIQNQTEESGSWIALHNMAISDIVTAHSWFRSLSSIADNTGFDTQRILNEYGVALSSYIKPRQKILKNVIKKIFKEVMNKDIDFTFVNEKPVYDSNGLFLWEYRRDQGLEFDENDPKQQMIIFNGQLINNQG